MECVRYHNLDQFKVAVLADLLEKEVDHSALIGIINKNSKQTEEFVMLAVHDKEKVNEQGNPRTLFVGFRTHKFFPMTLASLADQHSKPLEIFFNFLIQEKMLEDVNEWWSTREVSRSLVKLMADLGKKSTLVRAMSYYCLDTINQDVLDRADSDVSNGIASFDLVKTDDFDWAVDWGLAFSKDIGDEVTREFIESSQKRVIESKLGWKWQVHQKDHLVPVSIASKGRETDRVACIGGVYTPPEHRGKGYASKCVASVCKHLMKNEGKKWVTLFADKSNPTSNHIYISIGFKYFQEHEHYKIKLDQ